MGVLKSNLFNGAGRDDLEACAADHAFNFFQGKPANAGRGPAINRIRTALLRLGFSSASDGPGEYGPATTRAVLAYKGPPRMILGAGQRTPDAVVGRQTVMRLDKDILAGGLDDPEPAPAPPLEFGATSWRFNFFGNTSNGVFSLFVSSLEGQDSQQFEIRALNIDDGDLASFRGSSSGPFATSKKVLAKDFHGAGCTVRLRKELPLGGSGLISGFIELRLAAGINPILTVLPFADENLTSGFRSGVWALTGQVLNPSIRRRPVSSAEGGPALSPSAAAVSPSQTHGIRALRRHTFLR